MASNNRKPQQRWSRDGNDGERFPSLGQRAQQRPGGPVKAKRGMDVRKVEEALDDMFLNVFDAEVIRAVAQACDWKLDSAVEKLLTLSVGHDSEETGIKSTIPGSSMLQPGKTPKNKTSKVPSASLQQPIEDPSHKPLPGASEMSMWPDHSETSFLKPKSVLMNAGHSTIKVTYRRQADIDVSDDDADVVIEEEKEFEVYGFDTPIGIPSSQPMCQFLTPLVSADQQTSSGTGGLIASTPAGWKDTLEGAVPHPNSDASKTGGKKNKHWPKLEKIRKWIGEGIKVMVLMRGCPGSGKTSLARHIIKLTCKENHHNYVFSTDQFFSLSGKYVFNPKQLPEAHDWNRRRVAAEARKGNTPIIIDNTNIEAWEMKPYAQIAVECGYIVELLEPRTSWKNNAAECERKNIHGVSRRKIEDMLNRFDQNLTANALLTLCNLKYSSKNKPPQLTKLTHLRQDASQLNVTKQKLKKKIDPNKVKKKETKKNSEPQKTEELQALCETQSNDVFRDLVNIAWQQLPIESFLSQSSDTTSGITDSNTAASSSVTELINWVQDHHQESTSLTDSHIPLPKPVKDDGNKDVRVNDEVNEIESSDAVVEAGLLDDESIDEDVDDLNFDGFEESDSCSELDTTEKKIELVNINSCMEYVVVLSDGSAIPQFDHSGKEFVLKDVDYLPKRAWEYLVSQEELDELINPCSCEANSNPSSSCCEVDIISKMGECEMISRTSLVEPVVEKGSSVIDIEQDKTIEEVAKEYVSLKQKISENDKLDTANKDTSDEEYLVGKTSGKFGVVKADNDSDKGIDKNSQEDACSGRRDGDFLENVKITPEPLAEDTDVKLVSSVDVICSSENYLAGNQKENLTDKISDQSCIVSEVSNIREQNLKESSKSLEISNIYREPGKALSVSCELENATDVLCMEGDLVSTVELDMPGDEGKIKLITEAEFENACDSVGSDVTKQSEIVISDGCAYKVQCGFIVEDGGETEHEGQEENCFAVNYKNANHVLQQESALADKCVSEIGTNIRNASETRIEKLKECKKKVSVGFTDNESEVNDKEPILNSERISNSSDDPRLSEDNLLENKKDHLVCKIVEEPYDKSAQNSVFECISSLEVGNSMSVENCSNNKKENSEIHILSTVEQIVSHKKENSKIVLENANKTLLDQHVGNLDVLRKMEKGPGDETEQLVVIPTTYSINEILDKKLLGLETNESDIRNVSALAVEDKAERDLLKKWEIGGHWDEKGKEELLKEGNKSGESTPKPARQNRRQARLARSVSPIRTERRKKARVIEDVWGLAVKDPLKSWEKSNDGTNPDTCLPTRVKEPQPQRNVFALQRQDDKGIVSEVVEKAPEIVSQDLQNFLNAPTISGNNSQIGGWDTGTIKDLLDGNSDFQEQMAVEYQKVPIEGAWGGTCMSTIETNTHHSDFILLSNINIGSEVTVPGVKVMPAFCRDISNLEVAISDTPDPRKMGVYTLDKSSMTIDTTGVLVESGNIEEHVQELHRMFPCCPFEALRELFEKCNKDINWTVDLLLESVNQGIDLSTMSSLNVPHFQEDLPVEEGEGNDDCSNSFNNDNGQCTGDSRAKSVPSARRSSKKDRNTPLSEKSVLLKKQLEENIVINDEHYSEHVSRIRRIRHGELSDVPESEVGKTKNSIGLSSSPSDIRLWHAPEASLSSYSLRPEAPEWETKDVSPVDVSFEEEEEEEEEKEEEEEEETVQLKLDDTFMEQLHKLFGTASLPFKQDSVPSLSVSITLARQLHYYLMEAEQNTYDLMMQEDEELARQLQLQEDSRDSDIESKPADLREIMEMEMALAMYKVDQKQFHDESRDDMATRLKKNLLCEWFPFLPRDILVNVFEAHDHSFDQTIEVLFASTEEDNTVRTVMSPEARAAYEKALLERARQESVKTAEPSQPPHSTADHSEVTQERAFQDADFYRAEATRFYSLRNECQTKAQRAYQRGHPSVAAYYSQMAALHKLKIEENNARAASSLLLAHSLGNLTTTLDLHFLYVVEAIQVLDMFLDHHVRKMSGSGHRSKQVFVITGRGARSTGGRSRIKPAVVQRLVQRGLRHTEVNPGLLGVTITRNSALSTSVDG